MDVPPLRGSTYASIMETTRQARTERFGLLNWSADRRKRIWIEKTQERTAQL
jgi:hypothetical protein